MAKFAAALCLLFTATATAQPLPTDRVYVEFARPVRIPGTTLQPGQYLFVLGMPVGGQAVIDVYRDSRLIASCLAVESRKARPTDTTMTEYAATTPPALRAWFHPGNAIGFEFVYAPAEAKAIYLASGEAVPFASFGDLRREMVGTFAVAVSATPAAGTPRPVGTSGVMPAPARALGAAEHLAAARTALADRLGQADPQTGPRLVILIELIEKLEAAHRTGRTRETRQQLELTANTLGSLLPEKSSRFSGTPPLDADTEAALQRVRAHLIAFASFIR